MQPPEVFRLLTHQMPNRVIIFKLLQIAFFVCSVVALFWGKSIPWAIAAFMASFLCTMGWVLMRQKCIIAWAFCKNPQLVYWAHPTQPKNNRVSEEAITDCKLLTLHLRDGTHFQARLSAQEMRNFVTWLKERNSSMRWGAYDAAGSTTKTEGA
jgi:hypothetical protein